jgi:UDP-3-O-[3-hydroxymyristoyl] glucosamine N-acyltransferase
LTIPAERVQFIQPGNGAWRETAKEAIVDGSEGVYYVPIGMGTWVEKSARVHPSARLGRFVYVGDGAHVDEGAVIGDGTVIEAGAYIGRRAYIGARCWIGTGAVVQDQARLYNLVTVGDNANVYGICQVDDLAVIGKNAVIGYRCWIGTRAQVPPGAEVEDWTYIPFGTSYAPAA